MMIQAILSNPSHPEYGVATIPFPIPRDQYAHCMELLEALEIGDAVKVDCKMEEVDSFFSVLKRMEMLTVNVEELNYFAKRLDSFDTGEAAQFQAMAYKLELFELKDLINLTFCCQQATVITDFSDLAAIGRALLRGGITDPADVRLRLEDSQLPDEVDVLLDMKYETLSDLDELAEATDGLSKADMEKLGAVVTLAEPKSAAQIKNLAENLDLFDFAPGAHSPAEYGKYMIRQSGHFDYDENLDAFYDYEKYGTERMNEEDGMFTDRGYIAYKGYYSMEEVMNGSQSSHIEMEGFSR